MVHVSKTAMSAADPDSDTRRAAPSPGMTRRNRRTLILIALVSIAPVLASYSAYYLFSRDKRANYGELLRTAPAPELQGMHAGAPFALAQLRGKWVFVVAAAGACDAACERALYATRQARTIQGREMERVTRVWLVTQGTPAPAILAEHPDLVAVTGTGGLGGFPAGAHRIYLIDPLGNLVLAYPRDPDIKAMAGDVARLLRASRIG